MILFTSNVLKRGTQKCKQKLLVLSIFLQRTQEILSYFLCKERARKQMTSEDKKWVSYPGLCLKVTLQFSVIERCYYYYSSFSLFFFFPFSSTSSLKLNDNLWNFVVWFFLMEALNNYNTLNACDRAFLPPALSYLPHQLLWVFRFNHSQLSEYIWFPFSDLLCLVLQLFISQRGQCLRSRSNPPLKLYSLFPPLASGKVT